MSTRKWRRGSTEGSGQQGRGEGGLVFLSPEWVREVARAVEAARRSDEYFRRLSSAFSLSVMYSIAGLPAPLRALYGGKGEATIFVDLVKGQLRKLEVGDSACPGRADFVVTSDYATVWRIFRGELSPTRAFAEGLLRVEPAASVYRRPGFTARTLVVAGIVLRQARRVATRLVENGSPSEPV
jgi:hypothetical protein